EEVRAAGGEEALPVLQALRRTSRAGLRAASSLLPRLTYLFVRSARSSLRLPLSTTAGDVRSRAVLWAAGLRLACSPRARSDVRFQYASARARLCCRPRRGRTSRTGRPPSGSIGDAAPRRKVARLCGLFRSVTAGARGRRPARARPWRMAMWTPPGRGALASRPVEGKKTEILRFARLHRDEGKPWSSTRSFRSRCVA